MHISHAPSPDQLVYYSLPDLLPPGQVLVYNNQLGLLSHLASDTEGEPLPRLLAQALFSRTEGSVLRPLLENYPHFCNYEDLLAGFTTGQPVTDTARARAHQRLQEAQFAGVWDYEMRPVRNILSRVRFKLRMFGLDVRSILETGYILKVLDTSRERRQ